jgi:hypothetical protein
MSLAKKEIDLDSLSLEGLEDLLDQIFGTPEDEAICSQAPAAQTGCLNPHETEHSEQAAYGVCATLPDTKVSRHKTVRDIRHPKQEQVLLNQVKILRARLHFALEQLEHARLTEASLRLSLAHAQDQLKQNCQNESDNSSESPCEISSA